MKKVILDADAIRRALVRIAHEILEKNKGAGNLYIVGIWTRGYFLGRRLAGKIKEIEGITVPVGSIDVTFYRDDIQTRGLKEAGKSDIPVSVDAKNVVLVDDVLYTGRTIRAALEALIGYGRPKRVQLAVLIDRGHRELPVRADYVGKNIPTSKEEEIKVLIEEVDGRDEVILRRDEEK